MQLQHILGIKYPIIQGAMANITTGAFAAAVSNQGAMGIIATAGMSAEQVRKEIADCKALTDKPFGLNIMLMSPDVDAISDIVLEEGITFVTTGAGNPQKYMDKWKEAGVKVFPVVPNPTLAKRMEQCGADGVIAEGTESGGHVGEMTTMALVPQVVEAVNIPVIAAGGVATGKQLLAVEVLGAVGVQIGTCLLVSEECPIHDKYKQALLKAKGSDTVVTGRNSGTPVRVLRNQMTRDYAKREKEGADKHELESYTLGSLRRAVFEGDTLRGSLMTGQVCGELHEIQPLQTILDTLMNTYQDAKTAISQG